MPYKINNVTIVVGAGASQCYGFPTGGELIDQLVQESFPVRGLAPLSSSISSSEMYKPFRRALLRSQVPSIDEFLKFRPEFASFGKQAIASCLLPQEREEKLITRIMLRPDGEGRVQAPNWLRAFWHAIGCDIELLYKQRIRFIVFNYDRCVEHYLTSVIAEVRNVALVDAWNFVRDNVPIVHPHGLLGDYLPQGATGNGILFGGGKLSSSTLSMAADSIRLFWEQNHANSHAGIIKDILVNSRLIAFVGYGFHMINNQILTPGIAELQTSSYVLMGSSLGLSRASQERAQETFSQIKLSSVTAEEFFYKQFPHVRWL